MKCEAKKLANALMAAHEKVAAAARKIWISVHNLSEWDCGECGHRGLGDELDCDEDGAPICPWCDSDKVKSRIHEQDVADAVATGDDTTNWYEVRCHDGVHWRSCNLSECHPGDLVRVNSSAGPGEPFIYAEPSPMFDNLGAMAEEDDK